MVTDASQARQWDVASDPWGNALPLSTGTIAQDLRLPGQQMQAESGLFQNWMRDYDPTLGRYVEADPIGLAGGGNVFGYVEGNPANLIDPMGLQATAYKLMGDVIAGDLFKPDKSDLNPEKWAIYGGLTLCALAYDGYVLRMAKGGEQNKANEWSRAAQQEPDPCDWLKRQYNDPNTSSADRQKIKTAQKVLGCRRRG
jgi:RHS repeat-associated protein